MTESREILSPEQLRIQNFARQWEAAHPGKRADEYWDQFALDFAAAELERFAAIRSPMEAQQFRYNRGFGLKTIAQIDAFADALSAHNTAQLTKELAEESYMCLQLRQQVEGLMPQAQRCAAAEAELSRLRSQGALTAQQLADELVEVVATPGVTMATLRDALRDKILRSLGAEYSRRNPDDSDGHEL